MTVGLIATWNGSASSAVDGLIIQKVDRGMFGDVRDEEVAMPGREAAWVFGEVRGNRTIRAACQIIRDISERRDGTIDGARWLNLSGYQDLKFSDQPDRYWRAYVRMAPASDEWKHQSKFVIEWRAEPYAYSVTTSSQCVTATGGDAGTSGTFNIPDDLPAAPVIEITAHGGSVESYNLTLNGYELLVDTLILDGETQTVSSTSYTITGGATGEEQLTGAYDPSPMWTVDASGEFPLLEAGTNDWYFAWEGDATSVEICIYWRERMY